MVHSLRDVIGKSKCGFCDCLKNSVAMIGFMLYNEIKKKEYKYLVYKYAQGRHVK